MIDDIFAQRVFNRLDDTNEKVDNLCERVTTIETKYDLHIANKAEQKQDKKDRKNWYFGIVSFIFGAYIAIKELM